MNRLFVSSTLCILAGALIASGQVPSLINYQGRLTDAAGAPVTGSKNFSISIYDAATDGNLLYAEDIGAVTLDDNGVYSFQFGSAGTSNSQVTETLATTDAATLVYTKALANTGIVENSITVTDGTNTWNQSVGNPGVGATATANTIAGFVIGATITNGGSGYTSPPAVTISGNGSGAAATAVLSGGVVTEITITSAGSGYTGTPTISIAPPVIPFRVDYSNNAITATYSTAPTTGRTITASYRYGTSGISGALAGSSEQWLELTVDGAAQSPRQKVLAVPFAKVAESALTAIDQQARQSMSDLGRSIANNSFSDSYVNVVSRNNSIQNDLGKISAAAAVDSGVTAIDLSPGKYLLRADSVFNGPPDNYYPAYFGGFTKFCYKDGTEWTDSWSTIPAGRIKRTANPYPEKLVTRVESSQRYTQGSFNPTYNAAVLSVYSSEVSSLTYSCAVASSKVMVVPQISDMRIFDKSINVIASNGLIYSGSWDHWISIPSNLTITGIEVKGRLIGDAAPAISSIKILHP